MSKKLTRGSKEPTGRFAFVSAVEEFPDALIEPAEFSKALDRTKKPGLHILSYRLHHCQYFLCEACCEIGGKMI